jgi:hypothetical protein
VILVDTSGLLALLDRGEPEHARVTAALRHERGPLVVTDLVLAEADFLILKRLGRAAEGEFVAQVVEGVFLREAVTDLDLRRAQEIGSRYADLALGLTDATLMALGERLRVRRVLTLDRRHFATFRDHRGRALELVPA